MKVITTDRSNIKPGIEGEAEFAYVSTVFPDGGAATQVCWFHVTFPWGGSVLQQLGRDVVPVGSEEACKLFDPDTEEYVGKNGRTTKIRYYGKVFENEQAAADYLLEHNLTGNYQPIHPQL